MTWHRSTFAGFFALCGLVPVIAGCQFFFPLPVEPEIEGAEAPSQAVRTIGLPFEEGEVLEAQIFVEKVAAGNVSLRAGKQCLADGRLALPLAGSGHLGGLFSFLSSGDAVTSGLIDLDANTPLEAKWDIRVDNKRTFIELDFGAGRYRAHQLREEPEKKPVSSYKRVELATEQTPHDGHSLLGFLRRWDPPSGTRGFLYVVVGRHLLRIDAELTGRETIRTPIGEHDAIRIDGLGQRVTEKTLEPITRYAPKPFVLWLSGDEDRVPLRLVVSTDLAELTIDLTKHEKTSVAEGPPVPCADRVDKTALSKARRPRKPDVKRATPVPAGDPPTRKPARKRPVRQKTPGATLPAP